MAKESGVNFFWVIFFWVFQNNFENLREAEVNTEY